jgi:hypothetical protein
MVVTGTIDRLVPAASATTSRCGDGAPPATRGGAIYNLQALTTVRDARSPATRRRPARASGNA